MSVDFQETDYFRYSFPSDQVGFPAVNPYKLSSFEVGFSGSAPVSVPEKARYAVVIDSPHSGRNYPTDFSYTCSLKDLRKLEDAYVDKLCEGLEERGAHVLTAKLPRSYIDLSRARDCLDPMQVPGGLTTLSYRTDGNNERSLKFGTGLVFLRSKIYDFDIYAKGQEPDENVIMSRLNAWDGYHAKLSDIFANLKGEGKIIYHLDLHSCGREGSVQKDGTRKRRPDVIVHDKFGAACDPGMTEVAVNSLKSEGFEVALNAKPFKGGYMITNYGRPEEGVHSLQVEFVRDLYLDLETLEPGANFAVVKDAVARLTENVRAFAQDHSTRMHISDIAPEPAF